MYRIALRLLILFTILGTADHALAVDAKRPRPAKPLAVVVTPAVVSAELRNPAFAKLSTLCEINGRLYGAGSKTLVVIGEDGKIKTTLPTAVSEVAGLSSYRKGAAIIGDGKSNAVYTLDLRTGDTTRLFRLADLVALPSIASALKLGKLSGLACDGINVYIAVSAGYSSSVYRVNPDTKAVTGHAWAPGDSPCAITLLNGNLLVHSAGSGCVRRYDSSLRLSYTTMELPVHEIRGLIVRGDEVWALSPAEGRILKLTGGLQSLLAPIPSPELAPVFAQTRPMVVSAVAYRSYAILICGDVAESGFEEFWNDTAWFYKTLLSAGYHEEDIFVLYGNGFDYISADPRYRHPSGIVDYPATVSWLTRVLDSLRNGDEKLGIPKVTGDDTLLIRTSGHGTGGDISSLCLLDGMMNEHAFSAKLNAIACKSRVILMQQSHGGAFIDNLQSKRTFISTACAADQIAHRAYVEQESSHHAEYTYHLICAMNGKAPADKDGNAMISIREAHDWAASQMTGTSTPQLSDPGRVGEDFIVKYAADR